MRRGAPEGPTISLPAERGQSSFRADSPRRPRWRGSLFADQNTDAVSLPVAPGLARGGPTRDAALEALLTSVPPGPRHRCGARIPRAALGDAAAEGELVDAPLAARDGEQKARLAKLLGYVGTPNAQRAVAGEMRSDLTIEMPHGMRHSVRVDIVAALTFLYPDNPILWEHAVLDDEGYARIERFREQTFRTTWTKSRPPFLWIEGFPCEAEP